MSSFFLDECKERPWNSVLQLVLGGVMIFVIAIFAGPHYGCGPGNADAGGGVFTCRDGAIGLSYKSLIILCIVLASLCWGRAVSLLESRSEEEV